jgi:RimJ/RimL family protein N-acetyltransferase
VAENRNSQNPSRTGLAIFYKTQHYKIMKQTHLPEVIKGTQVLLRKHMYEIADLMFGYIDADRTRLNKYLPWVKKVRSVQDEAEYIRQSHEAWNHFTGFDYGIFLVKEGSYVGNIGVHNISWTNHSCEIGYWLLSSFEGKGIMSQALKLLEKELFDLEFNRLVITSDTTNIKNSQLPMRNGYKREAVLRENIFDAGTYRDTVVFSKLKEDYLKTIIPTTPS